MRSVFASSSRLGLLIAVLCLLQWPPSAQGSEPQDSTVGHHVAQGRFLLEGGQLREALKEFQAASMKPEGRGDPVVHELLARTAFRLGEMNLALESVRTAVALAESRVEPELEEFHEFLTSRFGKVLVVGSGRGKSEAISSVGPVVDPELKRVMEQSLAKLEEPAESGSTSIYLPVGSYRVGPHMIEVKAGTTTRMDLRSNIGSLGGGVFGERRGREGTAPPPARPLPSKGDPPGFVVRMGGFGLAQQSSPTGGGAILLAAEWGLGRILGLRIGGVLAVHRVEKITGWEMAPAGVLPQLHLGFGPVLPLGSVGEILPWTSFHVGLGIPFGTGLPEGYSGPLHFVHVGPDFELTLRFATRRPDGGPSISPEVGLRFSARESRPLDAPPGHDERPHLSIALGLEVGLVLGR